MKITVAGYGFVGRAIEAYLKRGKIETEIIDPNYYRTTWWKESPKVYDTNPDGVIICVNTPQNIDGSCDMSNVFDVVSDTDHKIPILIKSTISIEGWNHLKVKFPNHIITFSPEFLRAKTAIEDMLASKEIYLGGGHFYWWERILKQPGIKISAFDPEILILAKYFRNSFLATKVAFFNQIYDLCKATNVNYNDVSKLITVDKRIGDSHTNVTDERGFGGHCFPKDMLAIKKTGEQNNVNLSLISEAIKYNNKIRKVIE